MQSIPYQVMRMSWVPRSVIILFVDHSFTPFFFLSLKWPRNLGHLQRGSPKIPKMFGPDGSDTFSHPTRVTKTPPNVRTVQNPTNSHQVGGSSGVVRTYADTANSASDLTTNPLFSFPPSLSSFDWTRGGQIGDYWGIALDGRRPAGCPWTRPDVSTDIWWGPFGD